MSKKVFDIERSEKFMAGMSTSVDIILDETGKGTATVEWKRGEKKEFPVKIGQRLFINMWGGFPKVQVWDQPKPPKDPIMRFLWDNGFPKKKVWDWDDPRFVKDEPLDDLDSDFIRFLWTMESHTVKFQLATTEWRSSMTGNYRVGFKRIEAVAVKPGSSLNEIRGDFQALKAEFDDILVIRCPGY